MLGNRLRRAAAVVACAGTVMLVAVSPARATDDKYFDQQWNLTQVKATEAWARSTGSGIVIGVVDTGIDAAHPDLAGKVDAMADCIGGTCREGSAKDVKGHGTAVAGIAAATADNGVGIAGVAPDAHLVVAKALGDDGSGDTEDINKAIEWVVDHGARVVNLSLGDADLVLVSRLGTPLRPGIEYAWTRGAIPVLAAGNYDDVSGTGSANYGDLDAVVVGATDNRGAVAGYSTSLGNAKWGVVAPGGSGDGPGADVPSPMPGGRYAWLAGTSMATPHVSATLALLLAQGLDPSAAVSRLLATVDHSAGCGTGCQGRLDAGAAVAVASVAAGGGGAPASPVTAPAGHVSAGLGLLALVLVGVAGLATLRTWWWLQQDAGASTTSAPPPAADEEVVAPPPASGRPRHAHAA
ncbi:MAG: S8 family serine peptidase [Actinomycetota bacterium]|nr:S8 family serine peptidase [Actinomycetota bacterium]